MCHICRRIADVFRRLEDVKQVGDDLAYAVYSAIIPPGFVDFPPAEITWTLFCLLRLWNRQRWAWQVLKKHLGGRRGLRESKADVQGQPIPTLPGWTYRSTKHNAVILNNQRNGEQIAISPRFGPNAMWLGTVWAQIAIHSCYAAAMPPGPIGGSVSVWARRKEDDEGGGVDPMAVGGASEKLIPLAQKWWIEAATKVGVDMTGFDPAAPLVERIAWAIQAGLEIATVLSRFSSKLQHSTDAQVQHTVESAGGRKLYVLWEFTCVDEAEKGRRVRQDGLDRAKAILKARQANVLLVFKVSRLLRTGYKSFQFVNEEVVEEDLRAISTSQGIDTHDEKTWKALMYLHGLMDELSSR